MLVFLLIGRRESRSPDWAKRGRTPVTPANCYQSVSYYKLIYPRIGPKVILQTMLNKNNGLEQQVIRIDAQNNGIMSLYVSNTDVFCHRNLLDWFQPTPVIRGLTVEQTEELILHPFRDRTAASVANRHVVDLAHRCDFGRGAGHEDFVRAVELFA